jgi:hypothetical protein
MMFTKVLGNLLGLCFYFDLASKAYLSRGYEAVTVYCICNITRPDASLIEFEQLIGAIHNRNQIDLIPA